MTTETLMTDNAATTTEGQTSSQAATTQATEHQGAQGQAATSEQGNQEQGQQTDAQKTSAPEQYEFKMAEGMQIDAQTIGEFSTVAKELNLPQDAAQKLIDRMAPRIAQRQAEQLQAYTQQWAEAASTDTEFGGEALPQNLAVAKKAMDTFATPQLRELLNKSGLGNHPEVIRFMYRAGKAISEDGRIVQGGVSNGPTDPAKRLFPNQA